MKFIAGLQIASFIWSLQICIHYLYVSQEESDKMKVGSMTRRLCVFTFEWELRRKENCTTYMEQMSI